MYADDTHTTEVSGDNNKLAQIMRIIELSANPKNTEFMLIGHPRGINKIETLAPLKLNGTEIRGVKKTKSLGIIVDENLKTSGREHFKSLKGKVASGLSALKKLKHILPQPKLCEVYHALVESHLRYGNVVWAGVACQTRSYKRFSVYRIGHSQLLKMPNERTPGTVIG